MSNIKERYEICKKCMQAHLDNGIKENLVKGVVCNALKCVDAIIESNNIFEDKIFYKWENMIRQSALDCDIKIFGEDVLDVCSDCRFRFEHTVMSEDDE